MSPPGEGRGHPLGAQPLARGPGESGQSAEWGEEAGSAVDEEGGWRGGCHFITSSSRLL